MGMFTYEAYHILVDHLDAELALLTNSFRAIPCAVPLEVDPVGRISVPTNLEKITASWTTKFTGNNVSSTSRGCRQREDTERRGGDGRVSGGSNDK
ncbi:unnamed protein product [Arctia plantaginis]|uniref:Uncharacterized protein n=1 Tax=Arctia plantaginis TaxID=874455 RepID=A0A8S0ZRC7_ARCPL|nr:unnamed protein product [Arctia plantaginis]